MYSRFKRAIEDEKETRSLPSTRIITLLLSALLAGVAALISINLSGFELFIIIVVSVMAGPVLVWMTIFFYHVFKPIKRFFVILVELHGDEVADVYFGIEAYQGSKKLNLKEIEVKAVLPNGEKLGWVRPPYKTFVGSSRILLTEHPNEWPLPEGEYKLFWRAKTWGNAPLIIIKGKYIYKNGSWHQYKR